MLYNPHTRDWDQDVLDALEIPRSMLPTIQPSCSRLGIVRSDILGRSLPVTASLVDQQAALFGQACYAPGDVKVTYGTGAFILMNTGHAVPTSHFGLVPTVAWSLPDSISYALDGGIYVAGAAVQWLRDGLGIIQSAQETYELAMSVPDSNGVYFVPALTGLGSPWWDADARGLVTGITRGTTRAHLARAALEAIAHQVADVVDALPTRPAVLRADGGATANGFLMQHQADLLGIPVEVAAELETTALGAAALAARGRARVSVGATHEPRLSRDEVVARRQAWNDAVNRTRS